jgi:uracil-DNA glycosylase
MYEYFPLIEAYHQHNIQDAKKLKINPGKIVGDSSEKNGSQIKLIIQPEIEETWTIRQIVENRIPLGWVNVFKDAWPSLCDVSDRIENETKTNGDYYPAKKNLFRVFELCPLSGVKVVILGQDPYHSVDHDGQPIAQGMSFSVRRGVTVPPSLKNIYKNLARTIPGFIIPSHGDLTHWVNQGVFLLNTDLTVLPHKALSHHNYWVGFINKVINAIVDTNPNVIFLLWGREAQKAKEMIGESRTIFETSHPSGFSARYGFDSCDHFNQVNQRLIELKQNTIDWQIPL